MGSSNVAETQHSRFVLAVSSVEFALLLLTDGRVASAIGDIRFARLQICRIAFVDNSSKCRAVVGVDFSESQCFAFVITPKATDELLEEVDGSVNALGACLVSTLRQRVIMDWHIALASMCLGVNEPPSEQRLQSPFLWVPVGARANAVKIHCYKLII
eukprot:3793272-Amphidinium_carterae.1